MDDWTAFAGEEDSNDGLRTNSTICDFEIDEADPETGTTVVGYDHGADPLSIAVPALVAHCESTDPCSLPPLYDAVDSEALEDLFGDGQTADSSVVVSFRYAGYTVTADDGLLSVCPQQ